MKKEDWINKKVLTEQEVNLIKRRLNDGKLTQEQVFGSPWKPKKLTNEQIEKGYNWLWSQWKTPKGVERKNNPFNQKQQKILFDFEGMGMIIGTMTLTTFINDVNPQMAKMGINNYQPCYRVILELADFKGSFSYYMGAGHKLQIIN